MLKAAGFKTHAVLSTPNVGILVPDVSHPDQFEHEFTAVEAKTGLLFLDTSLGPVSPGVLANGIRGRSALLIGDSGASIIDIPVQSPVPNRSTATLKGKVNADGSFEGSARFEVSGISEMGVRRLFSDSADKDKETILRQLAGPPFQNAKVARIRTSDPGNLIKPFQVECDLSDTDFFAKAKKPMHIALGRPSSIAAFLGALAKPVKPFPSEPSSSVQTMDLMIDTSFTIADAMPVHRKAPYGHFDSDSTYDQGRLTMTQTLDLNGTGIAPADWDGFITFLHTAEAEATHGFTLDRQFSTEAARLRQSGAAAFARKDYDGAKRDYLKATKADPNYRSVWNDLGRTYAALHDYPNAEVAYRRQIEINPQDLYATATTSASNT